jgi:UPF0176 protein
VSLLTVAAFYKFIELTYIEALQARLTEACQAHDISGTILLAKEGLNGTIAGKKESITAILALLRSDERFSDLPVKYSFTDAIPFKKTKVLIKKEIVTSGLLDLKPYHQTGTMVSPEEWNSLIAEEHVLVIDTRNTYEVELGSFEGAIDPKTEKFSDFQDYVKQNLDPTQHTKIAMYCTGGIRCEKASSYLLELGFPAVYQLQGGILNYLNKIPLEESRWQGECFIFDKRVTV